MNPDIAAISSKILELLEPLKAKYEVAPWPDDADEYQLTHSTGAVLVIFSEWTFQNPTSSDGGTQQTGIQFQISTLNRSLLPGHQNPGAYTMIKDVYEALHGHQIEHDFLQCKRIRLVSQRKGRFHYAQQWLLPNLQL